MVTPEVFARSNGAWVEPEIKSWIDGEWVDVEVSANIAATESVEIGAYTTWFDDPSTSVMLHYQTVDSTTVACLYKKESDSVWQSVALFADKPFPFTNRKVRWFKLDGLTPDTIYETKLANHTQVHKFKTMPSTFSRSLNFLITSDQMNSVTTFQSEAPQGFQTMHNQSIDALILAGDGVHDTGTRYGAWEVFWQSYFTATQSTGFMIPIVYALGNHDGDTVNELFVYNGATKDDVIFQYNFFSNLTDSGYGAIDVSNYASLIFLNSGHTAAVAGTQTTWLSSALQSRQGRHILPFFHVGPYPGWYGYNGGAKAVRDNWTPLFTQYGVKVAATGHEHVSLVTKKVTGDALDANGVTYIGQGLGMGNITRGTTVTQDTWYVDYLSTTTKDFDVVVLNPDSSVDIKQVGLTGNVIYSKTL